MPPKKSRPTKDSTDVFDFYEDEAAESHARIMVQVEAAMERILKRQAPTNHKGRSLLRKPNGKLYTPFGDDTFQIRMMPTRSSPAEDHLILLFRWCDLYYSGYHCKGVWYMFSDATITPLPTQSQVPYKAWNGIYELKDESSYPGLGSSSIKVGRKEVRTFYRVLMASHLIYSCPKGNPNPKGRAWLVEAQMSFPAIVFSEALRNLSFRGWVCIQLTINNVTKGGALVPDDYQHDFLMWSVDSVRLFIEDPRPHPKLASRLAILKRRINDDIAPLGPQYVKGSFSDQAVKNDKMHVNIVVIGHSNSGKSTTVGHLLYKAGAIGSDVIEKVEQEATVAGKKSCKYSWLLDKLKAERDRDMTIDISLRKFETEKYICTITDAPGHRNFIKNMINGTTQADCAVLVIDSTTEDFKAGISEGGQTSEHINLAYALGVKQVICCCNKMDLTMPKYSKARYDEIIETMELRLKEAGYEPYMIHFVPISGFEGDNLVEVSIKMDWYDGPTLIKAIDNLIGPRWPWRLPLRIPIRDVYWIGGIGTIPSGCIQTGMLHPGLEVTFVPTRVTRKVGSVSPFQDYNQRMPMALPSGNVMFRVKEVLGKQLKRGHMVVSTEHRPDKEPLRFRARIIVLNQNNYDSNGSNDRGIHCGDTLFLDCQLAHVAVRLEELLQRNDKERPENVLEKFPSSLKVGDCGLVRIVTRKPIVVEEFEKFPPLARFALRNARGTVVVTFVEGRA